MLVRKFVDKRPDNMKKNVDYEESDSEEVNGSPEGIEESSSGEEESDDAQEDDGAQQGGDNSESEQDDGAGDENNYKKKQIRRTTGASSGEQCTFDLRNLVAVNSHQLDASALYSSKRKVEEDNITIPPTVSAIHQVDENQLQQKAQDGCAQLISALWQLPTESSDAGPLVTLPSYFEIKIPRSLVSLLSIQYYLLRLNKRLTYNVSYHLPTPLSFSCSLLLRQRRRQSGKSLPKNAVSASTKRSGRERCGTKPLESGCTAMDTRKPTMMHKNGPLWKSRAMMTRMLIPGKSCVMPSVPVSKRIWKTECGIKNKLDSCQRVLPLE